MSQQRKIILLLVYVSIAFAVHFLKWFSDMGLFFWPAIAGVITALFVKENRLRDYTKEIVVYGSMFAFITGFVVGVYNPAGYGYIGGFIWSFVPALAFHTLGAYIGMILKAIGERFPKSNGPETK